MKKEVKDQIIESTSALLAQYPNFYITDISGLNAGQTSKLRRSCFEKDIKLTVVKNTLFAIALKKKGDEEANKLLDTLSGNTAIMYTTVPNAPGKLIKSLLASGWDKPSVKGAYVQECVYMGAESLNELAAIKTREELIGDVITLLQSPARRVLAALENKENATPAETEPAAEAEAPAAETQAADVPDAA